MRAIVWIVFFFSAKCFVATDPTDAENGIRAFLLEKSHLGKIVKLKSLEIKSQTEDYIIYLRENTGEILADNTLLILENEEPQRLRSNLQTYQVDKMEENIDIEAELTVFDLHLTGSISFEGIVYQILSKDLSAANNDLEIKLISHPKKVLGVCEEAKIPDHVNRTAIRIPGADEDEIIRKKRSPSFHVTSWENKNYYIELYIVADNLFYKKFANLELSQNYIIEMVNYVNAYYREFYVHVVLVGLEIWTHSQKFEINKNASVVLGRFSHYRRENIKIRHDVAHLLTAINFDRYVLGLAFLHGICTYGYGCGINTIYDDSNSLDTANTFSHELAHNLGIKHDDETCECLPQTACLMNPYSTSYTHLRWSNCSSTSLRRNLNSIMSYCMHDKPGFSSDSHPYPGCGNGIVDAGEQCDPGIHATAISCCNPDTCQFVGSAECASGSCCNQTSCTLRPAGVLCSDSDSDSAECDFPEYCNGVSEFCPPDIFPLDSRKFCGEEKKDLCIQKQCGSRLEMCRRFLGSATVESPDSCYFQNSISRNNQRYFGYCSYTDSSQEDGSVSYSYKICKERDYKCGANHCSEENNEDIDFYWGTNLFSFYIGQNSPWCYHAQANMRLSQLRDPGLVPNGASCGPCKFCMNSECVHVRQIQTSSCSCKNGGQCNNFGGCYCPPGFRGPTCSEPCSNCCGGSDLGNYCFNNSEVSSSSQSSEFPYTECQCKEDEKESFNSNNDLVCSEMCRDQCSKNSQCFENVGSSVVCVCNIGYKGASCQTFSILETRLLLILIGCLVILSIALITVILAIKFGLPCLKMKSSPDFPVVYNINVQTVSENVETNGQINPSFMQSTPDLAA